MEGRWILCRRREERRSGNQGLMNVRRASDMPWAIGKRTCGLVPNYDIDVVLFMDCFEEVRPSVLQKCTKRIAGECHWSCIEKVSWSLL